MTKNDKKMIVKYKIKKMVVQDRLPYTFEKSLGRHRYSGSKFSGQSHSLKILQLRKFSGVRVDARIRSNQTPATRI